MMVIFLLTRAMPKGVSTDPYDWFVSIVGTWLPLLMRPGERRLFKVPGAGNFPPNRKRPNNLPADQPSFMLVRLRRVIKALPVPEFSLPDDADLQSTASGTRECPGSWQLFERV